MTFPVQSCLNKPPLMHYTRESSILQLLTSKSLLASPTYDFADTEEYAMGLRLIRARLKDLAALERQIAMEVPAKGLALFRRYFVSIRQLIDYVLPYIEHEVNNISKPNIEIFVACFTTNVFHERMFEEYGEVMIHFNFLLPAIAASCPEPFVMSMLSRVTYDEGEFIHFIANWFNSEYFMIEPTLMVEFEKMDVERARSTIAVWLAEELCSFAANIKAPHYAWENEWRLKSVLSKYDTASLKGFREKWIFPGLPAVAKFVECPSRRYLQELTLLGKFMSQGIMGIGDNDAELREQIRQWQMEHSMPLLRPEEFLAALATQE